MMSLCKLNGLLQPSLKLYQPVASFHNTQQLLAWTNNKERTKKWLTYNEKVYPPQTPDEEPRPAVGDANASIHK